jgi:predicted RNase H-like nuclease (RuvC/YqgF family)
MIYRITTGASVLTRQKINKTQKRIDRIETLLREAKSLVEMVKLDLADLRRLVEITEKEMKNGRLV